MLLDGFKKKLEEMNKRKIIKIKKTKLLNNQKLNIHQELFKTGKIINNNKYKCKINNLVNKILNKIKTVDLINNKSKLNSLNRFTINSQIISNLTNFNKILMLNLLNLNKMFINSIFQDNKYINNKDIHQLENRITLIITIS